MLILTEKPSVAKSFAAALNVSFDKNLEYYNSPNIVITNCVGHLYELATPAEYHPDYAKWSLQDLPIIPNPFLYSANQKTLKQAKIVKKLLQEHKNDKLVIATDADREGEIIARTVLIQSGISDYSNCYRFWVSEALTPPVINKGMAELKPLTEYNFLASKGFARQKADWLIGMNLSRFITLITGGKTTFSIGRVQTAILAAIAQRNNEVKNFVPTPYYECIATLFDKDNNSINALLLNPETSQTKFPSLNHYINQAQVFSETDKNITFEVETNEKTLNSPCLLGLTELQQQTAKLYNYSPKETLEIAQKLYEEYKCLSYPRTPSVVMGDDDVDLFRDKFDLLKNEYEISKFCDESLISASNKKIFNSKKLDSHHALIPLDKLPYSATEKEKRVFEIVVKYFFMSCMPCCVYNDKKLLIKNGQYLYKANIKTVIDKGWTICKDKDTEEEIISFDETTMTLKGAKIEKKMTKPKKEFTITSLLNFMKNPTSQNEDDGKLVSLGTPATRADIIQNLQNHEYVIQTNKKLYATEKGFFLLNVLFKNELTKKIAGINQTTLWEKALEESPEVFEKEITDYIKQTVSQNLVVDSFVKSPIGKCPLCGKNIFENKKSFYCEGYKLEPKCTFSIWKEILGTKISIEDVKNLLSGKETHTKKLTKKDGKTFSAKLKLNDTGICEFLYEKRAYSKK